MVAEKIISSNACFSKVAEAAARKLDYDYFLSYLTKRRKNNYLRNIGDLMFRSTGDIFAFSNGNPHNSSFPFKEITVALKNGELIKISGKPLEDGLSYLSNSGYSQFLDVLRSYQDKFHGNQDWSVRAITTVSGSQGGLHQVLGMCVEKGDPVIVQSPFYSGVESILTPFEVDYIEAESDEYGISAVYLRSMLEERKKNNLSMPKIFYVNPTGANPSGELIPTNRKHELYQIACDYNLLILEDDPYYLLHYGEDKITSFLTIDTERRVLRFDTFSKTLGPGFRMGYVTGPIELIQKLDLVKESSFMASPFCQILIYSTLESMGFDGFMQHVKFIKEFYRKNCHAMLRSLDTHLKDIADWKAPEAAMFIWLTIKNVHHIPHNFTLKCMEKSLFVVPGYVFYGKERKCPHLRLAFSQIDEKDIPKGIECLSHMIREELLKK